MIIYKINITQNDNFFAQHMKITSSTTNNELISDAVYFFLSWTSLLYNTNYKCNVRRAKGNSPHCLHPITIITTFECHCILQFALAANDVAVVFLFNVPSYFIHNIFSISISPTAPLNRTTGWKIWSKEKMMIRCANSSGRGSCVFLFLSTSIDHVLDDPDRQPRRT